MSIIRAHFVKTVGIHKAGETYLIEDAELRAALFLDALDRERVELVKAGPLDLFALAELLAPPVPEIVAVEDAPPPDVDAPPGGES